MIGKQAIYIVKGRGRDGLEGEKEGRLRGREEIDGGEEKGEEKEEERETGGGVREVREKKSVRR